MICWAEISPDSMPRGSIQVNTGEDRKTLKGQKLRRSSPLGADAKS